MALPIVWITLAALAGRSFAKRDAKEAAEKGETVIHLPDVSLAARRMLVTDVTEPVKVYNQKAHLALMTALQESSAQFLYKENGVAFWRMVPKLDVVDPRAIDLIGPIMLRTGALAMLSFSCLMEPDYERVIALIPPDAMKKPDTTPPVASSVHFARFRLPEAVEQFAQDAMQHETEGNGVAKPAAPIATAAEEARA